MTPSQYRAALATLGLSQQAAGRWLGVSPKTAQRYAVDGPSGPAARAVGMAVVIMTLQRNRPIVSADGLMMWTHSNDDYIRHSDLTAVVGLTVE